MPGFEEEINQTGARVSERIKYERKLHGFSLAHELPDAAVHIDLEGQAIDGVQVSADQSLSGTLVDSRRAYVRVQEASHQRELIGRVIGLAVGWQIDPAVGGRYVTRRGIVSPCWPMHYYFPADPGRRPGHKPAMEYHYTAATYGRVVVNGRSYFDVRNVQTN